MHSNKNEQTLSVLFMEKSFDLLIAMKWNLKRQGNNPYRSTNQMLESREWLVKKRDKHEVMRAINSCTFNAPSSNQQTFIHETELRSSERVIGKFFFFLFFYVFRMDFAIHFKRHQKLFRLNSNIRLAKVGDYLKSGCA